MPYFVFKQGRSLVDRVMKDKKSLIKGMKSSWLTIQLESTDRRSMTPNFTVDKISINAEHSGIIITIPQAVEDHEAVYLGIIYDKDYNFRYYTYEIGEGNEGETLYFLCECTSMGNHLNYSSHPERDKSVFIKELTRLFDINLPEMYKHMVYS